MNNFKVDGLTRALTRQLEILHPDLEMKDHLKTYIFKLSCFFLGFPLYAQTLILVNLILVTIFSLSFTNPCHEDL